MNNLHTVSINELWSVAENVLPGGVNASARLNNVLGRAFLVSRGKGSIIVDHEGREYIDLSMSHGASLLGYGHPSICEAVTQSLRDGILCAHETSDQISLAQRLNNLVPSAQMVRFCGTGTETTWHSIRLARSFTQKSIIIKFEGHFHGYNDYLAYSKRPPLDAAGPVDFPEPYLETQGVPAGIRDYVIVVPFNNITALEAVLHEHHDNIAAVIMEPVNYNSGTILPLPGYLQAVRDLTNKYRVLLIFDEILSGFQTGPDCIQGYFGVIPDLTTLGKALGGGMPLSALVGKKEIMENLAPLGETMHSGTYVAHPSLILAAHAFLDELNAPNFYPTLLKLRETLTDNMERLFRQAQLNIRVQSLGSRFSLLFGIPESSEIRNYRDVALQDSAMARKFYSSMLDCGVYFHPSWHHGISAAHTEAQIDTILAAVEQTTKTLK